MERIGFVAGMPDLIESETVLAKFRWCRNDDGLRTSGEPGCHNGRQSGDQISSFENHPRGEGIGNSNADITALAQRIQRPCDEGLLLTHEREAAWRQFFSPSQFEMLRFQVAAQS